MRCSGPVASKNVGNVYDLGSSPRSALFFILFFNRNSCAFSMSRHSVHLHNPVIHASWEIKSKAGIQRTRCTLVNAQHATQKSPPGHAQVGQITESIPPNLGLPPPWFAIFYFLFVFLFLFFDYYL